MGLVRAAERSVGRDGLRAVGHARRTRARSAACWPRRWTRPISSRPSTRCCDASGGTARVWRTDRLATVIVPGTSDVQASFAPVAKHYGAVVEPCPPRRGNRKGAVESSVRFVSGRWWRTMGATTPEDAQRSLDVFCATIGDERERRGPDGERTTVGELADTEPLLALPPAPFPATTEVDRIVADNASVAFWGNRYSVPPGLSGTTLLVRHRLIAPTIDVVAPSGAILVTHRLAPAGSGALVRSRRAQRGARGRRAQRLHDGPTVRQEGQPAAGQRGARRGSPAARAHRA